MTSKVNKTDVIFRVDSDGEPLAIFPYDIAGTNGDMTCYAHYGKHSSCAPSYMRRLKRAESSAFAALREELTSLGYELREINRVSGKKYTLALMELRS